MRVELNGEPRELPDGRRLADAVRARAGAEPEGRRAAWRSPSTARSCRAASGRRRRSPTAGGSRSSRRSRVGRRPGSWAAAEWSSRLIAGTGGFRSLEQMEEALAASGAEIVTVALRRIDPPRRARSST